MKKSKGSKEKKIDIKPFAGGATSMISRIWPGIPVCIIILGAFLIRLYHLYSIIHNDPNYLNFAGTDMSAYDSTAMQIVNGTLPKEPYSWYPAYCYFVATVYFIFGHSPVTAMVIQSLIGSITCWLVYLIGKKLFNKSVGIIAALLCSLYGTYIMYSAVLLSTALDTLLTTLAVFIGLKVVERKNKVYFLVLGVVLGLSILSRPNMLLVAPFFLIYLLIMIKGIKKALFASLLVIAGMVMMLAPVTIRNYVYSGGKFIPIVTGGSLEVWMGNNEDSDGIYYASPLAKYIEQHFKELGKEDPYLADTIEFITKKPDKFCLLLLKKLALFWNGEGIHDNNIMYDRIRDKSPILWLSLSYGLIAPLALTGMVLLLLRGRNPQQVKAPIRGKVIEAPICLPKKALLLYLVIFGFMSSIVLFFVQSRVRQPIIACLIIFASFAIYWFYKNIWRQKQKTSPLLLFVIIFGIFYGLVNTQTYMRWLYPIIKPHGFCIEKRYGTIIRDISGVWHGNKAVDLNAENKVLKKELFIDFEPKSKEKGIGLNMFYSCEDKGALSIEINGKKIPDISLSRLNSGGFYRVVRLGIKPEFFKRGVNTIIFRVTKGSYLQIPIDNYYKYKRSMFSNDNGKSWKVKDGEYMIYFDLQKAR
ncbi:MAG: glycosyltransferase family 39 protein [Nitrospirota bacterium]